VDKKTGIKDPAFKRPERGLTLIVTAEERGPGPTGPVQGIVYPSTIYIFLLIREVPLEFIEVSAILSVRTEWGNHYFIRRPVEIVENPYEE
jgi:hypothetical protein